MSEEQRNTAEQEKLKKILNGEMKDYSVFDKTPVSFPQKLTADQRAKAIRLCEKTIEREEEDCKKCWYKKDGPGCKECRFTLAKQLKEELSRDSESFIKCHFCDNKAVKTNDTPMCQECIDDTV